MSEHCFINEGPSFSMVRDELLKQYTEPAFDPATGLSSEELRGEFDRIVNATEDMPPLLQKSRLLSFVFQNARIDVDPCDYFADHFDGQNLLSDLRERKRKSVGAAQVPQAAHQLRTSAATGAFNAELDLGHISPGWTRILSCGVSGILEDAVNMHNSLPADHPSQVFYQALIETYSAFRIFILRLGTQAEKMVSRHPEYKQRMKQLSDALHNLTDNPPGTFYEALQLSYLFHQLIEYEGEYVRSRGSFERNFGRFYEDDLQKGRLSRENAEELIRFYWMKYFAKTLGKANGKNFYFGGRLPDGTDSYGELSRLALDCFYDMQLTDPKLSIRFHKDSSPDQYRRIARCIRDGRTNMVLVNDEVAIPALLMRGKTIQDAYNYLLIGCYEPAIEGEEIACNMSIKLNLAKSVELVLYNGVDPLSGETIGIRTGEAEALYSFDAFYAAYCSQLKHQVYLATESIKSFENHWNEINPSPLLSGTFAGCLASGRDISQGGAKYNNTGCMGGCLSNAADSLIAIKKLVYEEKRLTLNELKSILESDWQKDPGLQQYVKHRIPKWGNNNAEVDNLARGIADFYTAIVNGTPNNRGGSFSASMFSLDFNLIQGERTGALPDGRNARTYLAKGIGAMTAMDKQGVTAHIESVTKIDFRRVPNGSVLDIFLHPSAVKGEQGLAALTSLIKTYFAKGGFGIQFNILDHNALIDAQKHPEKYATLQVRLCGWNVYFVTLSPREQEQFIHTTMQELS